MPKRRHRDKIEYYQRKLRRLEEKSERRSRRIIDSSDSEGNSDNEPMVEENPVDIIHESISQEPLIPNSAEESGERNNLEIEVQQPVVELDPEILSALGESTEESPKFGEKIHENLSRLWIPILRKGLKKETKDKLLKEYLIPENCTLLQAPKLNPEISAAVTDLCRSRDKRVEYVQQQLGSGITALNRALTLLLNDENNKIKAIKLLSDSSRILCDLHHVESQARVKFVTPGLDKAFLNVIQDVDRDDMLFGSKLSEKIKASKVIEKQGLQIKKAIPTPKPAVTTSQPSTSRPRSQVNWMGPPRSMSTRGARGGSRKTTSAGSTGRRVPPATQTKPSNQPKQQRAPQQQ